jgi:V8-like Glu-specific endopeptidase
VTNNHCISDAADAANAFAEFGAECATVEDPDNKNFYGCEGVIVSNNSTFIITDEDLNFTLMKLNVEAGIDITKYGYLQARDADVKLDDPIYIAGHPLMRPRHISSLNDDGKPARITSTSMEGCSADNLGYNVDTHRGNSGSPILGQSDNKVVGLHDERCSHCHTDGTDENSGTKITKILALLRSKNLLPKDAVGGGQC